MKMVQLTRRSAALMLLGTLAACWRRRLVDRESRAAEIPAMAEIPATPATPGGGTTTPVTGRYRMETAAENFDAALSAMNALGAQGYAFTYSLASGGTTFPVPIGDFYVTDTAHTGTRLDSSHGARRGGRLGPGGPAQRTGCARLPVQVRHGVPQQHAGPAQPLCAQQQRRRHLQLRDAPRRGCAGHVGLHAATGRDERPGFPLHGPADLGRRDVQPLRQGLARHRPSSTPVFALAAPFGAGQRHGAEAAPGSRWVPRATCCVAPGAARNTEGVQLYEKSGDQQGAIEYRVEPVSQSASLAQRLEQFNRNAAEGFFAFGDVVTDDGRFHSISVRERPPHGASAGRCLLPLSRAQACAAGA